MIITKKDGKMRTNLLTEYAINYAKNGWKIFPCEPDGKTPLAGLKWKERATSSIKTIEDWWKATPATNIGLVCNKENDLFVIDIDNGYKSNGEKKQGMKSLEILERKYGKRLRSSVAVITRSGGLHYYFKHNNLIGNSAGKLGLDIDTRGEIDGKYGYVIAPPSIVGGRPYFFYANVLHSFSRPEVPSWILKEMEEAKGLDKPKLNKKKLTMRLDIKGKENPWIMSMFNGIIDEVISSGEGQRNNKLNHASFRMGRFVAGGCLNRTEVIAALHATGRGIGLDDIEVCRTIESGLKAGECMPLSGPVTER